MQTTLDASDTGGCTRYILPVPIYYSCLQIGYSRVLVTGTRRHRHRHRVASSGHRVTPPWPHRMAWLQRLAGTDPPVSLRSWSVQWARGRPERRLQSPPSEWPDDRPTWQCRALCAGVPCVSRAMWPNTDKQRLLMKSITGGTGTGFNVASGAQCDTLLNCTINTLTLLTEMSDLKLHQWLSQTWRLCRVVGTSR